MVNRRMMNIFPMPEHLNICLSQLILPSDHSLAELLWPEIL